MTKETMDEKRIRLGIPKQSAVCKCGHSNMVHVGGCFGRINGKKCRCNGFKEK